MSTWRGRLLRAPVEHPAWALRDATVTRLDDTLAAAAGLPGPPGPGGVVAHVAAGVPVRIGRPRRLGPVAA